MKRYDKAYFDRWYRGTEAPFADGALRRNVALAVAVAESILDREVGSVLDVGCGEGRWQPLLAELRPDASYLGIEPSEYAVKRFGVPRNIRRGSFGELEVHVFEEPFDLVVCADVLHYLPEDEIALGMPVLADLVGGAALIEVFTAEDPVLGDHEGFHDRDASWYRRAFRAAGLVPVGLQMYVHEEIATELDALDLVGEGR
jgi:SAM-dependent methyltransferase